MTIPVALSRLFPHLHAKFLLNTKLSYQPSIVPNVQNIPLIFFTIEQWIIGKK